MPFIPIANTAKMTLQYVLASQICQNVMHFEYVSSPGQPELDNLAANLEAWWTANLAPLVTNQMGLRLIIGADQTSQFAESVERIVAVDGGISSATDPALPNNVTCAVKHLTGMRGRSFRGRSYHVGLTDSQVLNNTLDGTFATNLESAYRALILYPWTDPGWIWVVASRFSNNLPRAAGVTTPINDVSLDRTVDSQRRRLPGRGR